MSPNTDLGSSLSVSGHIRGFAGARAGPGLVVATSDTTSWVAPARLSLDFLWVLTSADNFPILSLSSLGIHMKLP